jgi:hypothetical protein
MHVKINKALSAAFLILPYSALAVTSLSGYMANTCEKLGPTEGAKCVQLQRRMELHNEYLDQNSADLCSLIWRWGSQGTDVSQTGNLVLSCFQQVANLKISTEVKRTCDHRISGNSEFGPTATEVNRKVEKMLACIKELSIPVQVKP